MFSPVNELFLWIGEEKANEWHEHILPELKKIYSGNLVPRGLQFYQFDPLSQKPFETKNAEFNFSGWDYVASDFYCTGIEQVFSEENLKKCIAATLNKSIDLKNKYKTKGIIYGEMSHPGGYSPKAFDLFFKENYGKVSGWFLWNLEDYSKEAREIARKYFISLQNVSATSLHGGTLDIKRIASNVLRQNRTLFIENFDNLGYRTVSDKEGFEFNVPGNNYTVLIKLKILEGGAKIYFERDSQEYELQIAEASRILLLKKNPLNPEEPLKIAEPRREVKTNKTYMLEISRTGNDFAIYLDGRLVHAFSDPDPLKGKFLLTSYVKKGEIEKSDVIYEEVKVMTG